MRLRSLASRVIQQKVDKLFVKCSEKLTVGQSKPTHVSPISWKPLEPLEPKVLFSGESDFSDEDNDSVTASYHSLHSNNNESSLDEVLNNDEIVEMVSSWAAVPETAEIGGGGSSSGHYECYNTGWRITSVEFKTFRPITFSGNIVVGGLSTYSGEYAHLFPGSNQYMVLNGNNPSSSNDHIYGQFNTPRKGFEYSGNIFTAGVSVDRPAVDLDRRKIEYISNCEPGVDDLIYGDGISYEYSVVSGPGEIINNSIYRVEIPNWSQSSPQTVTIQVKISDAGVLANDGDIVSQLSFLLLPDHPENDFDNDGLTNEFAWWETNGYVLWNVFDTDGDCLGDGFEFATGTDPGTNDNGGQPCGGVYGPRIPTNPGPDPWAPPLPLPTPSDPTISPLTTIHGYVYTEQNNDGMYSGAITATEDGDTTELIFVVDGTMTQTQDVILEGNLNTLLTDANELLVINYLQSLIDTGHHDSFVKVSFLTDTGISTTAQNLSLSSTISYIQTNGIPAIGLDHTFGAYDDAIDDVLSWVQTNTVNYDNHKIIVVSDGSDFNESQTIRDANALAILNYNPTIPTNVDVHAVYPGYLPAYTVTTNLLDAIVSLNGTSGAVFDKGSQAHRHEELSFDIARSTGEVWSEPVFEGVRVYVDENDNGQFDTGEFSATTDESGLFQASRHLDFSLSGYVLRIESPLGYAVNNPSQGYYIWGLGS